MRQRQATERDRLTGPRCARSSAAGRRIRSAAASALLALAASCSFVRYAAEDEGLTGYAGLTALIADLEDARSAGDVSLEEWWRARRPQISDPTPTTWEQALGQLYAARSASVVHHAPDRTLSGTLWSSWAERPLERMPCLLGGLCVFPFDLVATPVRSSRALAREARVAEADLVRAAEDIARARALGYRGDFAGGTAVTVPPYGYLHVDRIGYDEEWLRRVERRAR